MSHEAKSFEPEVTPEMIEVGEGVIFAFGVRPDLSTAGWAASLAKKVYQAMEEAAPTMRIRSQAHNPEE
jgi:hypothetical protein